MVVCECMQHTLPNNQRKTYVAVWYRCCENNLHLQRFEYRRKRRNDFRSVYAYGGNAKTNVSRARMGGMMVMVTVQWSGWGE